MLHNRRTALDSDLRKIHYKNRICICIDLCLEIFKCQYYARTFKTFESQQ